MNSQSGRTTVTFSLLTMSIKRTGSSLEGPTTKRPVIAVRLSESDDCYESGPESDDEPGPDDESDSGPEWNSGDEKEGPAT